MTGTRHPASTGGRAEAATDAAPSSRPGSSNGNLARWALAGAGVVAALVPFTLMGPGTDLDVGAVLRSGRSILRDGDYTASRAPGAPVYEGAVGVLERIGGTVAPNLGSLIAATLLVALVTALLRREGVGRVGLTVAVVVANPWFLVAATSTVDFLWALALWAAAALVLRIRSSLVGGAGAGVLAGLAIGCRSSTAFLVAGLALAELLGSTTPTDTPPEAPRPVVRSGLFAVAAAITALTAYLPPFLAADSSLAFAQNDVPTSSLLVQVGRFLAKDLYFVGPFAAVVLVVALPSMARVLGRWRADWLVRIGAITVVTSQLLFLRFPWKMGHLLPTLVGLALLLGRAVGDRPRLLVGIVVAQLAYCVVSIGLVAPDNPNAATGAELTFDPRWGALVVDTQCRLDDPGAWKDPDPTRLGAVWDCAKPWAR